MTDRMATLDSRTAIGLVARREVATRLRSRVFAAGLVATVLVVFGFFGFIQLMDRDRPTSITVGVVGDQPDGIQDALAALADGRGTEVELQRYGGREAALGALDEQELDVVVDGDEVIASDIGFEVRDVVVPAWQQARLLDQLRRAGTDPVVVERALAPLTVTAREVGPGDDAREAASFGLTLMLFVAVQASGAYIMTGVMEEKTTKVVELVLSSIRARDLLIGKIVGVGVVSMAQVLVLVGATLAAAAVFGASVLPAFDLATVVWGLLWFVLGYLFWGSAYAAAASLTNGPEDSQSIMPVSVLMVLSYMIGVFGSVDPSSAGRVASWLPPIAPFAMPSRIVGGEVPIWEAVAVYGLAAVTTAGVVRLAERIYVRSILHLDRRVGWGEALFMERT